MINDIISKEFSHYFYVDQFFRINKGLTIFVINLLYKNAIIYLVIIQSTKHPQRKTEYIL